MNQQEFIEKNRSNMLKDLGDLIAIPSTMDMSSAGDMAPFGKSAALALDVLLNKAAAMGMEVKNYEGYAGEITVGAGSRMVGILTHIDVVPAGDGWSTPPFQLTVRDGKMYGRGVSDDKGPIISALYAMKYLMDEQLLPADTCVRLIVGADEEEGLRCITYYTKHAPRLPDCTFVADGNFPLVNCEKGLVDFNLTMDVEAVEGSQAKVLELRGGRARNIVADAASCRLMLRPEEKAELLSKLHAVRDLTVVDTDGICTVTTTGIATHSMQPEKGRSAINALIHGLAVSGISLDIQKFVDAYDALIGLTYNGEKMGANWCDELSGPLTFNVGTIEYANGNVKMEANTRYPVSKTYLDIDSTMFQKLRDAGFTVDPVLPMDPLYIAKDSPLIQKLMQAYRAVSQDFDHDPFAIGGATYARFLPNSVSFGPLFPDDPDLAHEANEEFSLASFEKCTEVYMEAIKTLAIRD